ncbi:MAG: alpha/beta fold hydrolase [Synechococcaceae cyanobacterium]
MTDPYTGYVDVNGTRLYVEVAGAGAPLVLIHGFALDACYWDAQFEAFARQHRVIRYDRRGCGRSANPTAASYSHGEDRGLDWPADLKDPVQQVFMEIAFTCRHTRNARMVVSPDAGHAVNLDAPARFNETVLTFLASIGP